VAKDLDQQALRQLLEVGRTLGAELSVEAVLERVLDVARELTRARYAALGILDDRRAELERFLVAGVDDETHRAIGDLPRGHGILGELIRDPRALRIDDIPAHPRSYGFPPGHPPMTSFLGAPILIRGEAWGIIYLTEKEGGPFAERDEQALVTLADLASVAIANARLYSDVERRRDELERAVKGLEATTAIARALGGETDTGRVLELIVKRARALVEARTVLILLAEDDHLTIASSAGDMSLAPTDMRVPIAGTVPGAVMRDQRSERLTDLGSRLRLSLGEDGVDASTALIVPLLYRGRSSGLLIAFDRLASGPEFSAEDERLLSAFAASAATAVATARSVADQRLRASLRATEEERKRWARELHDETLQGLSALRLLLAEAKRTGPSGDYLVRAIAQLDDETEKLRAIVAELRPAALDELGVGPALDSLIARARDEWELDVSASIDLAYASGRAPTRLEPDVESTLYRVVQEAITNVRKHAHAHRVQVTIVEDDTSVSVEVGDDGVGFDLAEARPGFGLIGMEERLALVGGELDLESAPSQGTRVSATVPARHRVADATASNRGEAARHTG